MEWAGEPSRRVSGQGTNKYEQKLAVCQTNHPQAKLHVTWRLWLWLLTHKPTYQLIPSERTAEYPSLVPRAHPFHDQPRVDFIYSCVPNLVLLSFSPNYICASEYRFILNTSMLNRFKMTSWSQSSKSKVESRIEPCPQCHLQQMCQEGKNTNFYLVIQSVWNAGVL